MKVDTPSPFASEPTSTNSKCIDLSKCYSKHFEEGDDGVPGICYTSSTGISCWTPVSKGPISHSSVFIPYKTANTSLKDLMTRARDVHVSYKHVRLNMHHPGLKVRTGCTSSNVNWVPIVASPVSHRTRSRIKLT